MKTIKYKIVTGENDGELLFIDKAILCDSDATLNANLPIAQAEAYNGEYTVEDDGQPEPEPQPTDKERLEALEAAMLEMLGVSAE